VTGSVGSVAGNVVGSVGSVVGLTASNLDATISSRAPSATAMDKTVWTDAKAAFLDGSILGVPALVWAYTTRTLTSLSALVSSIAAAVWAYATRTLTASAATATATSGSALTITKSVHYTATISGLTIPSDWAKMWLTLKKHSNYADASATIQIVETNPGAVTDGLLYLNGAASTASYASLTVDQAAGTVVIDIEDDATVALTDGESGSYDLKCLATATESEQLTTSTYTISSAQTLSIT